MAAITVVGGGLAGLACGWRLRRAGHDVRVLERGDQVGGRARSERHGAFVLDAGCPVVTRGQRRILALARETGLLGSLRPLAFGRDARWQAGRLVPAMPRDALGLVGLRRDPGARATLRAALDLRRPARVFDPPLNLSPERARRDAAADALRWWPTAPQIVSGNGATLRLLRAALPQMAPHAFAGGMGRLADALAERLDVVTDCEVLCIETDSFGAHLSLREGGRERSEGSDAVVVAVPATRVAALCPKLAPAERGFFESARFESGIVVQLLFERAPRGLAWRSVVFGPDSGLEVSLLIALHANPGRSPHGAGLLRATLSRAAAARMHRASDASIADLVLENLAYSPVGAVHPDDFAVFRHPDLTPRFDAEHAGRLAGFASRLERSARLAFAGDALAGLGVDAAVASGLRAASEITGLV